MAAVDVAGALALTGGVVFFLTYLWIVLTKRYSKAQTALLVLSVLSIIAAIWVGAANAWGQG